MPLPRGDSQSPSKVTEQAAWAPLHRTTAGSLDMPLQPQPGQLLTQAGGEGRGKGDFSHFSKQHLPPETRRALVLRGGNCSQHLT